MSRDSFIARAYDQMREGSSGLPVRRHTRRAFSGQNQLRQAQGAEGYEGASDQDGEWRAPPGVARSRGTKWRDPRLVGDVIGIVSGTRGWGASLDLGKVVLHWPTIAGPAVAAHCKVAAFEPAQDEGARARLVVQADSTAWSKQLRLLTPQIQRRIAEVLPGVPIPDIAVLGPRPPSWQHGKFSVKGRGQRDTYG